MFRVVEVDCQLLLSGLKISVLAFASGLGYLGSGFCPFACQPLENSFFLACCPNLLFQRLLKSLACMTNYRDFVLAHPSQVTEIHAEVYANIDARSGTSLMESSRICTDYPLKVLRQCLPLSSPTQQNGTTLKEQASHKTLIRLKTRDLSTEVNTT